MTATEVLVCLDEYEPDSTCKGQVEYRIALSATGVSYPRCDAHWAERLDLQQELDERYPAQQPADFDPWYAGETWDEDY